ncbi:hypothetical protein [Qipengyuania flava]|uniref:hypothetical protein n=1 Tax=Qipengyuania flava TaxID=192812 RepID=UPI001C637410|nr:hypothetical protein [Qipengyuania flava]QYJ07528.1 hypothetical protein KUV82_02040 [Qipengyuania flava]
MQRYTKTALACGMAACALVAQPASARTIQPQHYMVIDREETAVDRAYRIWLQCNVVRRGMEFRGNTARPPIFDHIDQHGLGGAYSRARGEAQERLNRLLSELRNASDAELQSAREAYESYAALVRKLPADGAMVDCDNPPRDIPGYERYWQAYDSETDQEYHRRTHATGDIARMFVGDPPPDTVAEPTRQTEGYIEPSAEQALLGALGIRDACERGEEMAAGTQVRYLRYYDVLREERDGLEALIEAEDDPDLKQTYQDRLARIEKEMAQLPPPSRLRCVTTVPEPDPDPIIAAGPSPASAPAPSDPFSTTTKLEGEKPDAFLSAYLRWDGTLDTPPPIGIGFQRDGAPGSAPENYADTVNIAPRVGFGIEAGFGDARLNFDYAASDRAATFAIPDTVDSGPVYGDLSPGGSSGIATPFGAEGEVARDDLTWAIGFGYEFEFAGGGVEPSGSRASVEPYVEFTHHRTQFDGLIRGSGTRGGFLFEYEQQREQEISEDHYELGARVNFSDEFAPRLRLGFEGQVGVYRYDTDLSSLETNSNNFTGPPDGSFTVAIEDDDGGFGFHTGFGAFAEYDLGGGLSLTFSADIDHRTKRSTIWNPFSGDQVFFDGETTRIETFSDTRYGFQVTLGAGF